ncbi:sulfatase [Myxococcota bacterium]|nr:sulfatase [Myxococcota bacterium]
MKLTCSIQFLALVSTLLPGIGCGSDSPAPTPPASPLATEIAPPSRAHPPDDAPNVLLITVDTLRADRLGVYGYPFDSSPQIDAFSRDAVVFDRGIAASSVTAPSHASMMTSRHTREHTVGWLNGPSRLGADETLAEAFQRAGYLTAGFVGNPLLDRRLGFDLGFDVYDDDLTSGEGRIHFHFERIAEQTSARAFHWLESDAANNDRPVFLWVHYQDPHGPYTPPDAFADHVRINRGPDEQPLPNVEREYSLGGVPPYQQLEGVSYLSEFEQRYANEIAYADHWIGRLLEEFAAFSEDRSERPFVALLTADHGESLGEGFRYFVHGHTTTPEVSHVPFILRAPDIEPGRRRGLVSHVDVKPTLLELAGIETDAPQSGMALGPLLKNGEPLPDRIVYCDIGRELSAYRGDGFVRVRGTEGAWPIPGASPDAPLPLSWKMYRWNDDGSWERSSLDSSLKPPVHRYSRSARSMLQAPPMQVREIDNLRALGYVVGD